MLPAPISKALTAELMRRADMVVVTGSQANVRAAYSSGTPAIGVGAGNVPAIVDATADLEAAADRIKRSKTFDYATSCSSENSLLIEDAVYGEMLAALRRQGGVLLDAAQKAQLGRAMFVDGKLNPQIVAQSPARIVEVAGLPPELAGAEFFMVEESGTGPDASVFRRKTLGRPHRVPLRRFRPARSRSRATSSRTKGWAIPWAFTRAARRTPNGSRAS